MRSSDWSSDVRSSDLGDGSPGSGKIRIEIGKGMEYILTDAESGRIIRDLMVPILKQDRPRTETTPEAITAGVREIMRLGAITPEQKAEFDAKIAAENARRWQATKDWIANFVSILFGFGAVRSEEPTSELQSLMRISY